MSLTFKTKYKGHEIAAEVNRPVTTKFSLTVDGQVIAESSRPASTDVIAGAKTWVGKKPVWEISGKAEIDGKEVVVSGRHITTFTDQYVDLYVDDERVGPEVKEGLEQEPESAD